MPLSNLKKGYSPPRENRKISSSSGNTDFDDCEPSITDDKEIYLNGEEKKRDLNNSDYMRGSVGSGHLSGKKSSDFIL